MLFASEEGIDLNYEIVDLFTGEHMRAWDTEWGTGSARIVIENSYVAITDHSKALAMSNGLESFVLVSTMTPTLSSSEKSSSSNGAGPRPPPRPPRPPPVVPVFRQA